MIKHKKTEKRLPGCPLISKLTMFFFVYWNNKDVWWLIQAKVETISCTLMQKTISKCNFQNVHNVMKNDKIILNNHTKSQVSIEFFFIIAYLWQNLKLCVLTYFYIWYLRILTLHTCKVTLMKVRNWLWFQSFSH